MHRDIKRDNILVNQKPGTTGRVISDFEFKLGDFGLAKQVFSKLDLNQTFAGTPLTMAPELVIENQYDYSAEVWSVGILLFQILTGNHPFNGKNMQDLQNKLKKGVYKIPKHIRISCECMDFLHSCLRFESAKRKDWDALLKHPFLAGGIAGLGGLIGNSNMN